MLPSAGSAAVVMNDDSSLARNSLAPRESRILDGGWTDTDGTDATRRVPQAHLGPK